MRNRLLVVDGEPRSRRVLDVNLRGAGYDVETASDSAEAWSLLEKRTPELIVCDADSPGVDALALCARVRESVGEGQIPVLLLSASGTRGERIRALEAGADDFLVKPAYLKEILTRVRALLQRRERDALAAADVAAAVPAEAPAENSGRLAAAPFSGDLAEISVVDLVQLVEHNGRSGIIHLRGPTGAPAFVYFRGGRVIDAEAGRISGLDALARLFSWTAGRFEVEWRNIRRKDVIQRVPSELVLDGMQRLDAWNDLRGHLGDPDAVFEIDYRLLAERLAEIPDEVNAVLRLCDGARTVLEVVEESSLSDTEALTALLRLREEGIVYDKATPTPSSEGVATRVRPDGQQPSQSGPIAAAAPRAARGADDGSGSVADSATDQHSSGANGRVRATASPRRTAPGLGQHTPPVETSTVESMPEPERDGGREQSNVIPFPAPPAVQTAMSAPLAGRADPTRVGFVPVTTAVEPCVVARAEATPLEPPVATEPHPMSMTLPLGRAQEVAALREHVLREQSAPTPEAAPIVRDDAAPGLPASMADTHRGHGPAPLAAHETSPAAGVPVEVVEPSSGPPIASGPLSAPTSAASGPLAESTGQSGRVRAPAAESEPASAAAPGETGPRTGARTPAAGAANDATTKVSFADPSISRRDALDELGMPSRWRGFRVLVGALLLGAGAAVGASRLLGPRGTPHQESPPSPEPSVPADQAAEGTPAPGRAAVVPSPSPAPPAPLVAAPVVELPAPSVPVAKAEPVERAAAEAAPSQAADPPAEKPAPAGAKELSDCRAAFTRNRLREALAACTAAAAANPRSAVALTMLAHTELNRGRLARANELAGKAIAIDPNQADAYVIIGGVHQDSGENREAKAAYRRYLELAPRGRYADELRSIVNGL